MKTAGGVPPEPDRHVAGTRLDALDPRSTSARPTTSIIYGMYMLGVRCEDGSMTDPSPSHVQISLLGGVRIHDGAGTAIDPLPKKCQELLAALALDPKSAITVGRLVDLLWGHEPPRTAEKTLQTYVARLRKVLGATAISRNGSAYSLEVDPASIDTFRFRAALARGDIETALHEWAGPPLAGVDTSGLRPLLERLTEEWLDAVEVDLEQRVATDPGGAIGRLTELVASNPFREGLWALLMTALYRTSRQAEALAAYRRARSTLIDELGVEPGPRLQELEQLILQHDDHLVAETEARRQRRVVPTGTVTFGFVELDRAAALWEDHPAQAIDLVTWFELTAQRVADDVGGLVFMKAAETVGVAFASASEATTWSVAIHQAMSESVAATGVSLAARVGLHTGEADERNGTYYGPSVTMGATLASSASPGQSIATTATAALAAAANPKTLGAFLVEGASQEQELWQVGPGSFPPPQLATRRSDQLPRPANRLIGREHLVATISDTLVDAPVVTLVGPGGIGKTRLAIEVIRRNNDRPIARTWFVNLVEVVEPADLARAVADEIGVGESSERSVLEAIVAALQFRPALVVLDNCEHLVDGVRDLVAVLVERCPDLTVLATSREGLGTPAEQLIVVGPLAEESASVDLFIERARAADRDFDGITHRGAIAKVCQRLDGVPLAIELAAARVRVLSPTELLARLDDSFQLLTGARRGTLERHRTLQATIQWSYDYLTDAERLLFTRLAVFTGPFDIRAVEAVTPDKQLPVEVVSALIGDLVDRSMCTVESGIAGRRFRLLEPIRQFALYQLGLEPIDLALRRRHASYVRDRVGDIRSRLAGASEIEAAAELDELWPNVRSALDWAISQNDYRLAIDLVEPVLSQGFLRRGFSELNQWIERVLEIVPPDDEETIANALLWTALFAQLTENRSTYDRLVVRFGEPTTILAVLARSIVESDSPQILAIAPRALEHADQHDDRILVALIEVLVGGNLLSTGQMDEAESHVANVMARTEQTLPPTLQNWLLYMAATLRALRGDHVGAEDLYEQVVATALPPGANSPNDTLAARRAMRRGDHAGAYAILREHLDDLLIGDNLNGVIVVAQEFITIMIETGRYADAAWVLGYFDASRDLDAKFDAFETLLEQASTVVAADPTAAKVRLESATLKIGPRDTLDYMAATLDALLDAQDAPPGLG